MAKEDRGFASMDRGKQREIASKGGKAAHQKGTAHEWTSEEAREAGRKGGMASHRRKQEQTAPAEGSERAADCGQSNPGTDDGHRQSAVAIAHDTRRVDWTPSAGRCAIIRSSRPSGSAPTGTGRSSNGRTHASGACYRGSNPCLPANSLASLGLGWSARLQSHPDSPSAHSQSPRLIGNGSESLLSREASRRASASSRASSYCTSRILIPNTFDGSSITSAAGSRARRPWV